MKVQFRRRDNITTFLMPDVDIEVERYSNNAIGGPDIATIHMAGSDVDLWNTINMMRFPVDIYSDKGDKVWWGYLSQVDATVLSNADTRRPSGKVRVGVSMDGVYNSVAVAYAKVDLSDGSKSRDTTAYFSDTLSIAEFGIKELLWSPGAATEAHANAAGTAKLYQSRYPEPVISPADIATESGAVLTCRGWWDTLGWRYYSNDGTASVDTATQAGSIITSKGQFFNTIYQDVTSGISLRETRDGDNTALYYTMQMLETGTTNFRRMLAKVDQHRNVTIYEEPQALTSTAHKLRADGSFHDPHDNPIRNELCPAGFWARTKDIVPPSVDSVQLGDASLFFVESMEYDVANDKLTHRARGDPDPWEFPVVNYG